MEEWKLTDQEVSELTAKGGDIVEAQKAKKDAYFKAHKGRLNIEEIRLTAEEKCKAYHDIANVPERYVRAFFDSETISPATRIANTATDKANEWWIDWLEPMLMKAAQELYCNADGWMIYLTKEEWQALKKLVSK